MIYYDYKINEKGVSVCELIAETTKDSLVTCDFGVAPETEKVVQKNTRFIDNQINCKNCR